MLGRDFVGGLAVPARVDVDSHDGGTKNAGPETGVPVRIRLVMLDLAWRLVRRPHSGRTVRSQGWASAVERIRPGRAGATLTGR